MDHERYADAIERIDAANGADPETEEVEGRSWPKALLYGQRMSACLEEQISDATEALRLAVRCQHIQRWKMPRGDFPGGRLGYRQWRTELARYHAQTAGEILEDVACLVFLRYYLPAFKKKQSENKVLDTLARTWKKMSEAGRAASRNIDLSPPLKSLLDRAIRRG